MTTSKKQFITSSNDTRYLNNRQVLMRQMSRVILYIFLIVSSFVMLVPFFWMILSSFKTEAEIFLIPPRIFPTRWAYEVYIYMWQSSPWVLYFFNTTFITVLTILGQIITCSLAAYAFAKLEFKGRDILFFIFLGTMMIPFQVVMIPQFVIIRNLGWMNTHSALIVPSIFSAFGTFMLRQFFMSIPRDLEEAAKIDGCSYPKIYYEIIMKNSKPALMTLVIFTFMGTWNEFLRPLIFLQRQDLWTLALGLARFQGTYVTQWNQLMAGALITMFPVLVVFMFAQRYFIEGIVMSGMKE